jgi:hypothetical protein
MREAVERAAQKNENIHYFGFVPHQKALALQASAHALINPRQRTGLFEIKSTGGCLILYDSTKVLI